MSAISASGLNVNPYLQAPSAGTDSQAAQTAQAATQSTASTTDPAASDTAVKGAHHHHHHGGGSGNFKKIEQAVTSALQSAQGNSSADPNTIIKDAITQVLQGNDPTSPTSASSDATTNSTATDQVASGQSFTTMLQSLGVNPQQFHADFVSAVQAAQGGQIDPSTALQSFPPGTTIDTTA